MTDTIDSIHQAFAAHRERQRLGPYPRALRERALQTLNEAELAELGARLKLTPAQVQQWRAIRGVRKAPANASKTRKKPSRKDAAAFYEVPVAAIAPPTPYATEIEIAVELASGAKMQIKGPFANDFVRALLTDLQAMTRAA
jgi:hypothetical protein